MTTSTVAPEIVRFAEGVRAALADLPADEVDELTDGLEADLAESLAEDLRRTLPDPVAYAAELRLAAGLPVRQPSRGSLARLSGTWRDARDGMADVIARNPSLGDLADFVRALRPVWWVLRALIATWVLAMFFGDGGTFGLYGAMWIVLAAFVVISVQWGRGRWAFPGLRGVVIVGNVIAILAVPAMASAGWWGSESYPYGYTAGPPPSGLSMDGQPLDNVYAYDATGNPISGVQLFDVDGKPLLPYRDVDSQIQQAPATLETGEKVYNVYPLAVTLMRWDENGQLVPDPTPVPSKAASYANGPFLKVPAVQTPQQVAQPNE